MYPLTLPSPPGGRGIEPISPLPVGEGGVRALFAPNPLKDQSIVTTTLPMALRLARWVMALPESARLKVSETWGRILPST